MTVTDVRKDPEALTLTISAQFAATMPQVWQMWADPRRLERWWGPPTWPATFTAHDLTPGGAASYYMTGPDGEQACGWWRIIEVAEPHLIVFEDGFADDQGNPVATMPSMIGRVVIEDLGQGMTTMQVQSTFASAEAMQQVLDMGAEEGMVSAMGQIDELLLST